MAMIACVRYVACSEGPDLCTPTGSEVLSVTESGDEESVRAVGPLRKSLPTTQTHIHK